MPKQLVTQVPVVSQPGPRSPFPAHDEQNVRPHCTQLSNEGCRQRLGVALVEQCVPFGVELSSAGVEFGGSAGQLVEFDEAPLVEVGEAATFLVGCVDAPVETSAARPSSAFPCLLRVITRWRRSIPRTRESGREHRNRSLRP